MITKRGFVRKHFCTICGMLESIPDAMSANYKVQRIGMTLKIGTKDEAARIHNPEKSYHEKSVIKLRLSKFELLQFHFIIVCNYTTGWFYGRSLHTCFLFCPVSTNRRCPSYQMGVLLVRFWACLVSSRDVSGSSILHNYYTFQWPYIALFAGYCNL